MNLKVRYFTRNDCYTANRKINPAGVMVHSTAAPGVMAEAWYDRWNKSYKAGEINRQACVHAFVDDFGAMQCLPWDHRSWHCGVAYDGGPSANNTHISFELCEPMEMVLHYRAKVQRGASNNAYAVKAIQQQLIALGMYSGIVDGSFGALSEEAVKKYQAARKLTVSGACDAGTWAALAKEKEGYCKYNPNKPEVKAYFEAAWKNAVNLTAMLCEQYKLNPLANGVICHSEGHAQGVASNHADVMHWFPLHGKTMDMFRQTVKAAMGGVVVETPPADTDRPELGRGDKGAYVEELQRLLRITVDGSFGPITENTVKSFQQKNGLPANGVCDAATWAALLTEDTPDTEQKTPAIAQYRIRKSAADAASQVAAYATLEEAIIAADNLKGYKVYDIDGELVYDPAAPAPEQTPAQITVASGVADGVITATDYWTDVINGKTVASGANVKALIDKYHTVLQSVKSAK